MSRRSLLSLTLLAAMTLCSPVAYAQSENSDDSFVRSSRGVSAAGTAMAVRADAISAANNPALAALAEQAELQYAFTVSDVFGAGHGVYAVLPAFGLGLVAGAELLSFENQSPFLRRYLVGVAAQLADFVGFGLRYDVYGSDQDLGLDQASSLALGLSIRPIPQLAASILLEHVDTPRFRDDWLDLVGSVGVGLVLCEGCFRVEGSYHWGLPEAREGRVDALLAGQPTDGLELFGETQLFGEHYRWGGGLRMDLGPVELLGAAYALSTPSDAIAFDGFGVALGVHPPASDALLQPRQRWLSISVPSAADERAPRSPFGPTAASFAEHLARFDAIAEDPSVRGVLLRISGSGLGYSQLYELRAVIARMRSNGKSVFAHLDDGSMRSLYLASAAEQVYMSAPQVLSAMGVSVTLTYYRDFLDTVGITPDFAKIDEYKAAPDAFLRSSPSAPEEEQIRDYLDGVFEQLVEDLALARGLDPAQLRAYIDTMPMSPPEAAAAGLIDGVAYADEMPQLITSVLGLASPPRFELNPPQRAPRESAWSKPPLVAVIHIDGTIVKGPSVELPLVGTTMTGSDAVVASLDWALRSRDVVAIVLRVDSPGGSAHGSDLIHRALARCAELKPVVVSMSNTATSGGYYVSAPAHRIFATPMTLTGSIGIFAGKASVRGLLSLLGINQYTFKRGYFADIFSLSSAWTEEARAQMRKQVEYLYGVFLERVLSGRSALMDGAHLRALAEGHIYGGRAALALGLVDELGGLEDAVSYAAKMAGYDEKPALVQLPRRGTMSGVFPSVGFDFGSFDGSEEPPLESVEQLDLAQTLWAAGSALSPWLFGSEAVMLMPFVWSLDE